MAGLEPATEPIKQRCVAGRVTALWTRKRHHHPSLPHAGLTVYFNSSHDRLGLPHVTDTTLLTQSIVILHRALDAGKFRHRTILGFIGGLAPEFHAPQRDLN